MCVTLCNVNLPFARGGTRSDTTQRWVFLRTCGVWEATIMSQIRGGAAGGFQISEGGGSLYNCEHLHVVNSQSALKISVKRLRHM
jgi:hypothetical protein